MFDRLLGNKNKKEALLNFEEKKRTELEEAAVEARKKKPPQAVTPNGRWQKPFGEYLLWNEEKIAASNARNKGTEEGNYVPPTLRKS